MTQVFVKISYDILTVPGLFKGLSDFIGHFQVQQTIQQSHDRIMELWFFTDKVEIEEGKIRQVEIICKGIEEPFSFEIKKINR